MTRFVPQNDTPAPRRQVAIAAIVGGALGVVVTLAGLAFSHDDVSCRHPAWLRRRVRLGDYACQLSCFVAAR